MRLITILTAAVLLVGCGQQSTSSPGGSQAAHSDTVVLELGTYSQAAVHSCGGTDCQCYESATTCQGVTTFGDVTIYGENSATFFNSIPEPVSFDSNSGEVTLTSNTTGHAGLTFVVSHTVVSENWRIDLAPGCCRLYGKVH